MTVLIALLISIAFTAILLLQWRKAELARRAERGRAAAIERLIDRFRDSEDFVAFTRSEEGRLLLGARDHRVEIARTLLLIVQAAILLAALGAGFIASAVGTPADADINLIRAAEEARYWGTMCLALAAGLTAAFGVSQNRAHRWGLIPQ